MPLSTENSSKPYETDWETIAQDRFEIIQELEKRITKLEEALKRAIECANYEELPKRKLVDGWSDLIQFPNKVRNAP